MHSNNLIVCVWVDLDSTTGLCREGNAFYKRAYDLGVDMITSDYPLTAHQFLCKYNKKNFRALEDHQIT